jgi:hypothetical protein
VLARFSQIRDAVASENRGPDLSDILTKFGGSKYELCLKIEEDCVQFSLPQLGSNDIRAVPLYSDELSGAKYFFAKLPISYLFHDDKINPRSVGGSLGGLVEEFFRKRPQLHVALAWADLPNGSGSTAIRVFDGQHKTTAQVLLGVKASCSRVCES